MITCIVFALHGRDPCSPWSAPAVYDSVASESGSDPTGDDSLPPGFLSAGSTTNTHIDILKRCYDIRLNYKYDTSKGQIIHNTAGLKCPG